MTNNTPQNSSNKFIAISLNIAWLVGLFMLLNSSTDGFEFRRDYIPIILISAVLLMWFNIGAFKKR